MKYTENIYEKKNLPRVKRSKTYHKSQKKIYEKKESEYFDKKQNYLSNFK